uniref:HECT and RLD domain containing E3 ubiquitin protein ligase 3 n=1 Tax=Callorhinchus milii TaxID=7868 RepID=A0A4W3I9N5_CALMI
MGARVELLCWGYTNLGQLGLGDVVENIIVRPRTCEFFSSKSVQEVACGRYHTAFVLQDGSVYTCGSNNWGQLGHEKEGYRPEQVRALDAQTIKHTACGESHTLAVNDHGQVFAWGAGKDGQLGIDSMEETVRKPRLVKSLSGHEVTQVTCGSWHCMALTKDGQLFAWGQNTHGQLGLGQGISSQSNPQCLKTLVGIPLAQITAGGAHSFALSLSGAVFSWGRNHCGQLGLSDEKDRDVPFHVKFLRSQKIVHISCGEEHTAALTKSGGVFTFGSGLCGQLGHNFMNNEVNPRRVQELMGTEVSQISCGRQHTLAFVPSSGLIYAFGRGNRGQLGTGHTFNAQVPYKIPGNWVPCKQKLPLNAGKFKLRCSASFKWRYCCQSQERKSLPLFIFIRNDEHFKTGPWSSGVDLIAARLFFDKMAKTEYSKLLQQNRLIAQLPTSPPDFEAMRAFLILPVFPLFQDPKNYLTLTLPFAAAVLRLDANPSKVLDNWWSEVDIGYFCRLVEIYKNAVVFLLTRMKTLQLAPLLSHYVIYALRVLEKLYKVNMNANRVAYDVFYVHELNNLVNIETDYLYWASQQAGMCRLRCVFPQIPVAFCTYPFVLNARAKTKMLQTDAALQMQIAVNRTGVENIFMLLTLGPFLTSSPFLVLHVQRDNLVSDALRELSIHSDVDLKKPLKVRGLPWFRLFNNHVLIQLQDRIVLTRPGVGNHEPREPANLCWLSCTFVEQNWFHLIGILCGLAIYNFTVVDLHFPLVLYKKLLNVKPSLDDLKELSPTEGRENYGIIELQELVPGGNKVAVKKENRKEYVEAYVDFIFNNSIRELFLAFSSGFLKVSGGKVLHLFQPSELMAMVVGNTNFNWKELEMSAIYKGEYHAAHPTIKLFWEVLHQLPLEKKKLFLLFLTGSDRIPIYGMASIRMMIQPTSGGEQYLPVAHTCYNLLDLPKYQNKETLRTKLIQAIDHHEGFSLV